MPTPPDHTHAQPNLDGVSPPWTPNHPAVHVERDPGSGVLVWHDGHPFQVGWDDSKGFDGLFDIACRYLKLANSRLGLPGAWIADLRGVLRKNGPPLRLLWLREPGNPRHSYWVNRCAKLDEPNDPEHGNVLDRTAVLLAALHFGDKSNFVPSNGGQGIRIAIQVAPPRPGKLSRVRITGVSSTLPFGALKRGGAPAIRVKASVMLKRLNDARKELMAVSGLAGNHVAVDVGFQLPDDGTQESGVISLKTAPMSFPLAGSYAEEGMSYQLYGRLDLPSFRLISTAKFPLISHADADVFVQDPASRNWVRNYSRVRPNRPNALLDPERENVQLGDLAEADNGSGKVKLEALRDANGFSDFVVTNSWITDRGLPRNDPKEIAESSHASVRTNEFAAANAFYHTRVLFDRLRSYGLPVADYFKFVERPVVVRYRSGIHPGAGDGRTRNAMVRWTLRPEEDLKGRIEVCFALGDMQSGESAALGIASDPRWCWHEYSHVLISAAMGEMEFRFAHSAGDAMAAIVCDPQSKLARDFEGGAVSNGRWRGATFPWVDIPRRHDRDVQRGWGWTGPMNRPDRYFPIPGWSGSKGYWTEQILSSSLFRLYRAIGGDSLEADNAQLMPCSRTNAADYAVYLIMRTIQSLGPASSVACRTPGAFGHAMKEADTVTISGPGGYVGGTVHKVIQWAFERQGLYGVPVPGSSVIGPESRAKVDLHIDDSRPAPDGPYSPVDLNGTAWHAHPKSIGVTNSGSGRTKKIRVRVRNRGVVNASKTRVDVWCAPVVNKKIPDYPGTSWQWIGMAEGTVPRKKGSIPGSAVFGPIKWHPHEERAEYAILAAATCNADRSNIDPATGHPCVTVAGPIQYLVACDNNLALKLVNLA